MFSAGARRKPSCSSAEQCRSTCHEGDDHRAAPCACDVFSGARHHVINTSLSIRLC